MDPIGDHSSLGYELQDSSRRRRFVALNSVEVNCRPFRFLSGPLQDSSRRRDLFAGVEFRFVGVEFR